MSEETGQESEREARQDPPESEHEEAVETESDERPEQDASEAEPEEEPEADADEEPQPGEPEAAEEDEPQEAAEEEPDEEPERADGQSPRQEASEDESGGDQEGGDSQDPEQTAPAEESEDESEEEPELADDQALEPEASEHEPDEDQDDNNRDDENRDDDTQDVLPPIQDQDLDFDEDRTEQLPPRRLPPADLAPPADRSPGPSKRQLITVSAICVALLLGMVWGFLLHRFDTGGPHQITGDQLQGLKLDGVWDGPGGARITLTGTADDGSFTFSRMSPLMFVISDGDWPASDNDGTWSLGQMQGSQWSESGLVLRGGSGGGAGAGPQLMLLPIGSASSPQLACYFPLAAGVCVFKRE